MAELNWVAARAGCSPIRVFEEIKMQIEADVAARNAQRAEPHSYVFETAPQDDKLVVFLNGSGIPTRRITFIRTDKGVSVRDHEDKLVLEATLTLNDEGDCRLKVRGEQREFWQFRRMALESLFFDFV